MNTYIKTTEDGRKVEVIGAWVCLDGKKEADDFVLVEVHPNRAAILAAVPNATHMAGRLPLTAEETLTAYKAMKEAQQAYNDSEVGIAERIRKVQKDAIANRD